VKNFSRKARKEHKEVLSAAGSLRLSIASPNAKIAENGGFAANATSLCSLRALRETTTSLSVGGTA
jgi:hypothetical protein